MTELPRELTEIKRKIRHVKQVKQWLNGLGFPYDTQAVVDEVFQDFQRKLREARDKASQPQPPATPARQCATCSKPLHSVDTGDVCPACAYKHDKTKAPF